MVNISHANLVALHMRHLPFDSIGVEPRFIQCAGSVGSKAVGCAFIFAGLVAVVAKFENGAAHGVIAHAFFTAFF